MPPPAIAACAPPPANAVISGDTLAGECSAGRQPQRAHELAPVDFSVFKHLAESFHILFPSAILQEMSGPSRQPR